MTDSRDRISTSALHSFASYRWALKTR